MILKPIILLVTFIICYINSNEIKEKKKASAPKLKDYIPSEILNMSPKKALKVSQSMIDFLPKEFKEPLKQNMENVDYSKVKRETHLFINSYKRYIKIYEKKAQLDKEPVDYFKAAKRAVTETLARYRTRQLVSKMVDKLSIDE